MRKFGTFLADVDLFQGDFVGEDINEFAEVMGANTAFFCKTSHAPQAHDYEHLKDFKMSIQRHLLKWAWLLEISIRSTRLGGK
jgi:hypothetical protein